MCLAERAMSDMTATILLVLGAGAFGWAIYCVLSTLNVGGPSSKRADYASLGGSAPEDDRVLQEAIAVNSRYASTDDWK